MEDNAASQAADTPDDAVVAGTPGRVLSGKVLGYARPALIAAAAAVVVCIALLIIIFALDTFNAAAYSVAGKDINDATEEARNIRELYSGARIGGTIVLVAAGVIAVSSAVFLYLNRDAARAADDEGDDVDLDDLTGN